tara:strand:- start:3693 stop:4826 length:1134 start_codon:yes stop_codon:yes gene_type:complete
MTFVIPTAVDRMLTDYSSATNAAGAFSGTGEAQFSQRGIVKVAGNLPLTDDATNLTSSNDGQLRGSYWSFPSAYDVSTNTKLVVWTWQFNAPNRIQIDTAANDGLVFRLGSGTATPPANYKTWKIAGNDKVGGSARENPKMIIVDMNDSTHDAEVGTYDNTDVESFGLGAQNLSIVGTGSCNIFVQRLFVFDTTKGATNIPRFTGTSSWSDMITAMGTTYSTKITDDWIKREGDVFSYAAPFEIGNNAIQTNFDDGGVTVFWPDATTVTDSDPRVRVTSQAFRAYLNLRDNFADSADFSGFYNCGSSNPDWNFNLNNRCFVSFNGATFVNTGTFTVGSAVSGNATFDRCGVVRNNGASLNGSTLKNPNSTHLMRLAP